jgi:hypothetical protein
VLGAVGDVAGEGLAKSRRRLAVRRGPPACTAGVRGGASSPSSEGVGSAAAARGRRAAGGGLVARGAVGTSYALRVGVWRLWNMCALRLAATVKPATLHRLAPHASRLMGALPRHNCAKRGKPTQQASQAGSLTNTCRAVSAYLGVFRLRCDVLPGTRAVAHISLLARYRCYTHILEKTAGVIDHMGQTAQMCNGIPGNGSSRLCRQLGGAASSKCSGKAVQRI